MNFYCYGSTYRYQGNCAAYLGSQATAVIAPTAALSQSLATVSGATYNYSFALAHVQNFLASPDNTFSATIDGHQVSPQLTNSGAFSYAIYSGTFVASANATTIEFDVVDRGGNFNLDAVSVRDAPMPAAVPEPATWAMMIAGVGMIGGAMRRRSLQFAAG
ncbi:PEPxxWA-CTERM sorting domain-containing protein [uncultured Sphingomonas sp.]|uniref:PEPxxWA-CTERM sorting domain-containing protein n=1 Tax=uncultured Sphingomonas sp. TaxID=158754 RepID=UPI0035C94D14